MVTWLVTELPCCLSSTSEKLPINLNSENVTAPLPSSILMPYFFIQVSAFNLSLNSKEFSLMTTNLFYPALRKRDVSEITPSRVTTEIQDFETRAAFWPRVIIIGESIFPVSIIYFKTLSTIVSESKKL